MIIMFELLAWVQISLSAGSFSGRNFPLYYCLPWFCPKCGLHAVWTRFARGLRERASSFSVWLSYPPKIWGTFHGWKSFKQNLKDWFLTASIPQNNEGRFLAFSIHSVTLKRHGESFISTEITTWPIWKKSPLRKSQ